MKATDAVMAPPCDQHPWFETCKAQANCGAVHQMRHQVVGERLDVVLPDRLVDSGERQDDVVREPKDSPESQTPPPVDPTRQIGDKCALDAPTPPPAPGEQVFGRAGPFVRQGMPQNTGREPSA